MGSRKRTTGIKAKRLRGGTIKGNRFEGLDTAMDIEELDGTKITENTIKGKRSDSMENVQVQKFIKGQLRKHGPHTVHHVTRVWSKQIKDASVGEFAENLNMLIDREEVKKYMEGAPMVRLNYQALSSSSSHKIKWYKDPGVILPSIIGLGILTMAVISFVFG